VEEVGGAVEVSGDELALEDDDGELGGIVDGIWLVVVDVLLIADWLVAVGPID
jgi:hypothetical protein